MENSLIAALSRQTSLLQNLDVVGHNLANVSTPGFKSSAVLFQEYLDGPEGRPGLTEDDKLSLATDFATTINLSDGPLEFTGNPLDVALRGPGFMVVETDGGPRYSRYGALNIDVNNILVDTNRLPVLDVDNQPIEFPEDPVSIEVRGDGTIVVDGDDIAQIQLVEFEDAMSLETLGGGLYVSNAIPQPAEDTSIAHQSLEGSNVDPLRSVTTMIEVNRAYQGAQSLISEENDRIRNMLRRLGQSPS